MKMRCENCKRIVDEKPCPYCQSSKVRPLEPGETPDPNLLDKEIAEQSATIPAPKPQMKAQPKATTPPPAPPPATSPLPAPQPPSRPRSVPAPPPAAAAPKQITNLADFEKLLASGYKAVALCGLGKSGKSEIASGFTRANSVIRGRAQVSTTVGSSGSMVTLGGTESDTVWYEPMNTRRKLVFLDPWGEFFERLSPSYRRRLRLPDVTPEHFAFVQAAVKRLAAVVLVVDLTRTLDELADAPWRDQELALEYTLAALRWLRRGKAARDGHRITDTIATAKHRRLDVPVLVLFSKADQLAELTNEIPLDFARRKLSHLHSALITHARHFRFEFAHTMLHYGKDDDRQAERPCGVLLSMEWLLTDPFLWVPRLPTRWLGGGK